MRRRWEEDEAREREEVRRVRVQRENEEKKEYELAYNFCLIKQQEEEKIKKIYE